MMILNEILTLEIGGYAVSFFEKNEKFQGIKIIKKLKKNKNKIKCDEYNENGVVKKKIKNQKNKKEKFIKCDGDIENGVVKIKLIKNRKLKQMDYGCKIRCRNKKNIKL